MVLRPCISQRLNKGNNSAVPIGRAQIKNACTNGALWDVLKVFTLFVKQGSV